MEKRMNETFDKLDRYFNEALDMTVQQRREWLDTLAESDPKLHDQLRVMLGDLTGAEKAFGKDEEEEVDSLAGKILGEYRLLEVIGAGGMGVVYKAERLNFPQTVAVKILPGTTLTRELRQRFQRERDILAKMEHPNLTRLIDGGIAEDGVPYLVMEYVNGKPINDWVENHQSDVRTILKIFMQVCDAVAFAHRNLVIHRDIKPSNILVTEPGRVKLLDFGIAKIVDTEAVTLTFNARLTPRYASPEQWRGESLTTATDVFSLGVVLYELLTGIPYRENNAGGGDSITKPMLRPSSALKKWIKEHDELETCRKGKKRLEEFSPDLDAIVLKALEYSPSRRYGDLNEFRRDLGCFLDGKPVSAQPAGWHYYTRKFIKRNKLPVALSALLVLSLLVGFGASQRQAHLARQARDKALEQSRKATQVSSFLVGLFENANPKVTQGENPDLQHILELGLTDVNHHLADLPEIRADLHGIFGRIYMHMHDFDNAVPRLREFSQAFPTIEDYDQPGNWLLNHEFLAEAFIQSARYDDAQTLLARLLPLAEQQKDLRSQGVIYSLFGFLESKRGEVEKAENYLEKAVAVLADCEGRDCREAQLTTYLNQGYLYIDNGRIEDAERVLTEALKGAERLDPPDGLIRLAALSNLAVVHIKAGRPEDAIVEQRELIELKKKYVGSESPSLALSHQNLAHAFLKLGRYEEAKQHFREAEDLFNLKENHPYRSFPVIGLSKIALLEGDTAGAQRLSEQGLSMMVEQHPKSGPLYAQVFIHVALCRLANQPTAANADAWRHAYGEVVKMVGTEHPIVADAKAQLQGLLDRHPEGESVLVNLIGTL